MHRIIKSGYSIIFQNIYSLLTVDYANVVGINLINCIGMSILQLKLMREGNALKPEMKHSPYVMHYTSEYIIHDFGGSYQGNAPVLMHNSLCRNNCFMFISINYIIEILNKF